MRDLGAGIEGLHFILLLILLIFIIIIILILTFLLAHVCVCMCGIHEIYVCLQMCWHDVGAYVSAHKLLCVLVCMCVSPCVCFHVY